MTIVKDFVRERPLSTYFVLTFIISWGAVLILVGFDGVPVDPDQAVTLGMAILLGPSITSILLTGIAYGKAGFRELGSRLIKWHVGLKWYAVAILIAPLTTAVVLLVLSFFSSEYTPSILISDDKAALLLTGIVAGLFVGFFEELGWTGFAIPRMKARGVLATGLTIGIIWGAWHFILFWESDSFSGTLPFALLLARLFSWLPAYRILMAWVYENTESLLVVILMHTSLVGTLLIIDPVLSGGSLLTFILVRAAALWIIAATVTATQQQKFEAARNN
jgi:membrane protease YdiL (CAAX protease family)